MADEFDFFSNDSNNWNYNPFINTPNADPCNKKRVINISSNNSYSLMKYNAVIMLKEISKHTSKYLNDDVKEWIFKKALKETGREKEISHDMSVKAFMSLIACIQSLGSTLQRTKNGWTWHSCAVLKHAALPTVHQTLHHRMQQTLQPSHYLPHTPTACSPRLAH